MNLNAIALSLLGILASIVPAFSSATQHLNAEQLISCAPTETQDSSSQQEPPTTTRS